MQEVLEEYQLQEEADEPLCVDNNHESGGVAEAENQHYHGKTNV